ncbi:MAG: PIN/TRAM domain-containing protein [Chloroflexia bacterium]
MSFNVTIRVLGMVLFAVLGLLLGLYLVRELYPNALDSGFNQIVLPLVIVGALFGLLATPYMTVYPIRQVRERVKAMNALDLLAAAIGLFAGLLFGALFTWPLSNLPGWLGQVGPIVTTLVFAWIGVYAAVSRRPDISEAIRSERERTQAANAAARAQVRGNGPETYGGTTQRTLVDAGGSASDKTQFDKYVLVDTSAIIDGRIADITQTGFIDGTLLVPRFVLNELQHIADSPDPLRRARGRRGLDMLNRLQRESGAPIQISEVDADDIPEVDGKLVKIARTYHCPVITNDFNLNRVAEIQGVKVLNINELANALKPVVLPGEDMNVHIIQEGKELGQGIAYLDDGTMIVIENGKKYMNADVDVTVTRVLQTVAGRMIFAQMKNGKS